MRSQWCKLHANLSSDKEIRANQRFRSKSQRLREQNMWQLGKELQVSDDFSTEDYVAIRDWFRPQAMRNNNQERRSSNQRRSTHIASKHAGKLSGKTDAIKL